MIYLACPYSHALSAVRESRILAVNKAALMLAGRKSSKGVRAEIKIAMELGMNIEFMRPPKESP